MAARRALTRRVGRAALAASAALAFLAASAKSPPPRHVAVRFCEGWTPPSSSFDPVWAKRRGIELQTGAEGAPVPRGFEVVHVCVLPAGPGLQALVARFPVSLEGKGFSFDGRSYSGEQDAILLSDPGKAGETFVFGDSEETAVSLGERRLFRAEESRGDYIVVSGGLNKAGRFVTQNGRLTIDRATDLDAIAARDEFYRALKREKRASLEWENRESEKATVARWEKAAAGFAGKKGFLVRVYPDAAVKALYTGSSAPADLEVKDGAVRVDLDASSPEEPDLVSPVLAAAGLASANPALASRPTLLAAAGARRVGRWWGRDVKTFASFARAAGVEPSIEEVLLRDSENLSPVLGTGAAASWLDAGVRIDSEAAVMKALAEPDSALGGKLTRWRDAALRQTVRPPDRRPLPPGFLRGVSYAMSNSIEGAYVSPRSLETLRALRGLSVNSISVIPYAFQRDAKSDGILFVHTSPRGETDEGTVRAVVDARSLGMTAMVKPQLWVGEGAFTGDIAMGSDAAWRAWFDSYRRFVVHHAVVAEAAGAALFCVGTELKSTEERKNDWKETIAAARLATGAPLTYAANWAAHAGDVPFWDALDAIGVDFYDPLGRKEKLSDAALLDGARRAASPFAELSRQFPGKPVIFTEAGYPPVKGAWMSPHDEDARRPASPEDAARSIAALYRALGAEPWWKGVYWWKVFSDGKPAAPGDRGFNVLGTPSEKAIRDGFKALETR